MSDLTETETVAHAGLNRCQSLKDDFAFNWFYSQALAKPFEEARQRALDINLSTEERDRAAHIYNALKAAVEFLPRHEAIFRNVLKLPSLTS